MKTLQEIIDYYIPPSCQGSWYPEMMKEYALHYSNQVVQEVLEQIEDCKFSQLGELIEKLKEEYK